MKEKEEACVGVAKNEREREKERELAELSI